jgi:hypothetical protein
VHIALEGNNSTGIFALKKQKVSKSRKLLPTTAVKYFCKKLNFNLLQK